MKKIVVVLCWLFTLVGCTAYLTDYEKKSPKFALFDFFDGKTKAWGMVQDYKGQQIRRFDVNIVGTRENNQLKLNEVFVFDDGEILKRAWNITQLDNGQYQGTASDVIGIAIGEEKGNVLHWKYEMEIAVDGNTYTVTMDDWIYRQDEKRAFNITSMKKFGLEVGKITIFFEKQ